MSSLKPSIAGRVMQVDFNLVALFPIVQTHIVVETPFLLFGCQFPITSQLLKVVTPEIDEFFTQVFLLVIQKFKPEEVGVKF